jgi:hypothetical protein
MIQIRGKAPILEGFTKRRRESQRGECQAKGCLQTTTANKPYCLDHLDELPYVRQLMAEIARREASGGDLDPKGPEADELLLQLSVHGAMTLPRLGREIEIPPERLLRLVRVLEKAGRVRVIELRDERGKRRRVVQPLAAAEGPDQPADSAARSPAA